MKPFTQYVLCLYVAFYIFFILFFIIDTLHYMYTLKNIASKRVFAGFYRRTILASPQKPFSQQFLKFNFFLLVWRIFLKSHELFFFTIKNLLSSGKVPWMLKVLHGATDANKNQPLFLSGQCNKRILFDNMTNITVLSKKLWSSACTLFFFVCLYYCRLSNVFFSDCLQKKDAGEGVYEVFLLCCGCSILCVAIV